MKNSIGTSVKSGAVATVKVVTMPLHLGVQVATNLLYTIGNATCSGIAKSEGFLVEHIDGTPRALVAQDRYDATQATMLKVAVEADKLRSSLQIKLDEAKAKADSIISSSKDKAIEVGKDVKSKTDKVVKQAKALVQPAEDAFPDALVFQASNLRKQLEAAMSNTELSTRDRNALLRDINGKLSAIAKLTKVPTATPAQAFDVPATA